jgi:hypothetical protein
MTGFPHWVMTARNATVNPLTTVADRSVMAAIKAGPAHAVAPETGPAIAKAITLLCNMALLRDMVLLRGGANSRIPPKIST